MYSIELNSDKNQENCNFNYYGSSSTDQAVISEQIRDICSEHRLGKLFKCSIVCWQY